MITEVPVDLIKPNPNQPRKRFDPDKLQELADSIAEVGLLNPVLVRPSAGGDYEIVHGERRWRACQLAGLTAIRAEVRELDDKTAFLLAFTENLQRDDLDPIEEARALATMLDKLGYTQSQAAKAIGKSQPWLSGRLALLKLPDEIQEKIITRVINPSLARELSRVENADLQAALASKAEQGNLTVRQLEAATAEPVDNFDRAYLADLKERLDNANTLEEIIAVRRECAEVAFRSNAAWIKSTWEFGVLLNVLDETGGGYSRVEMKQMGIPPRYASQAKRLANIPEEAIHDYFGDAAEEFDRTNDPDVLTLNRLLFVFAAQACNAREAGKAGAAYNAIVANNTSYRL